MSIASTTGSWSIPVGGQQVRVDDGANSPPAGLQLVNRGDNGGTVWIAAGPAGTAAAVPLGPGATLQWTDPAAFPYAFLSRAATQAETLVCTGQASGYSNPSVVAAALVQQGIPSTMLDTDYGGYQVLVTQSTPPIMVGASSTLIVSVSWPQPPAGSNVLRVRFDDPASSSFAALDYFLTAPNGVSGEEWTWQVPVVAPRVTFTNLQPPDNNNGPADLYVVGNNRPAADGLRMLNQPQPGAQQLWCPVSASGTFDLMGGAHTSGTASNQPTTYSASGSRCTRFTGACTASVWVNSAPTQVFLYQNWINAQGQPVCMVYVLNGLVQGAQSTQVAHPPVPCYWRLFANVGSAGAVGQVLIAQN